MNTRLARPRWKVLLPVVLLCVLGVFLGLGLTKDPRKLPSVLVGKAIPNFQLPVLNPNGGGDPALQTISAPELAGAPWVLNVFASWCQACVVEHPHLLELARQKKIRLVGLAYKDDLANTRRWLAQYGNPYDLVLIDQQGQYGIELGVYGVPETFLMSAHNTVLHKQVGPVSASYYDSIVSPALEASR